MNSLILHTDETRSGDTRTQAAYLLVTLRIGIGLFFCIAGISKIFILTDFGETIRQIMPAFASTSPLLAAIVVGIEILCGAGLILNRAVRSCTVVLGLLVTLFLFILAVAIQTQHTFMCHCFGIIPIALSNSTEFILNLFILDLLSLLFSIAGPAGNPSLRKIRWTVVITAAIILYGQISTAAYLLDRDMSGVPVNLKKINSFLSGQTHGYEIIRNCRHIVLLRLSDFNCPPCFDDFVGYSRLIQQYSYDWSGDERVLGLVEQSGSMSDSLAMQAWKSANDIRFHLFLVPDSVFQQFQIDKSCVVHQRPYGRTRFVYSFPGDEAGKKKLISALLE